jgi:carbamate kinase
MNAGEKKPRPIALIAFGGNALVPRGSDGNQDDQLQEATALAEVAAELARDHRLLLIHGNGPQVGHLLVQVEAGRSQVPPWTLDTCGAASQGVIGYFLEAALRARLSTLGLEDNVSVLLTLVEVAADDPALDEPTKPIGPFYPGHMARDLQKYAGWKMVQQEQGWRRVVPSPSPRRVYGVAGIRALLAAGHVVIAGGGGGVPVVRGADGSLIGVEAVIDKDRTAALLVQEVGADLFVILTNVDRVERDYGTDRAAPIDRMTPGEARRLMSEGQFPPGSMGPKIEAALSVVESTGRPALICSVKVLAAALRGMGGTWLVADSAGRRAGQ